MCSKHCSKGTPFTNVRQNKADSEKCSICNEEETVIHLVYECEYAMSVWSKVNEDFNFFITLVDVILGTNVNDEKNVTVILLAFVIYKGLFCQLKTRPDISYLIGTCLLQSLNAEMQYTATQFACTDFVILLKFCLNHLHTELLCHDCTFFVMISHTD